MGKFRQLFQMAKRKFMSKKQYAEYLQAQGVVIGSGCNIDTTAFFGSEPWLIRIGNNTRITQGVRMITHDGGLWTLRRLGMIAKESDKYGKIVIGDNCNIGWDVIIMPNVTIGNNCVVAAGAVVTRDIPDNTVFGGVPARQIETLDEYYEKVKDSCVPTATMSGGDKKAYLQKHKPELFQ